MADQRNGPRAPWTIEDLRRLREDLEQGLHAFEAEHPDVRPLPPMDEEEAKALILAWLGTAEDRTLTRAEAFLCGQLLSTYCMAVEARMLGRRGRYYVISEKDLERFKEHE